MRAASFSLLCMTLLAGCSETSGPVVSPADAPLRTGSATDEKACLDAVAAESGNTVAILSSDFSQANTIVMVGVGPERAPWRCLVSGGVVAEVAFTGDEGKL